MRNRDLARDYIHRAEVRLRALDVLIAERDRLPEALVPDLDVLTEASRQLRRDRELSFYGAEDLTPSAFYSRADGEKARARARTTVELVQPHITDSI